MSTESTEDKGGSPLGLGSTEGLGASLPNVEPPGRNWTDVEIEAFPLWAKVCYCIRPFNSRITTYAEWVEVFGYDNDYYECDCGSSHETAGFYVRRLLAAFGA